MLITMLTILMAILLQRFLHVKLLYGCSWLSGYFKFWQRTLPTPRKWLILLSVLLPIGAVLAVIHYACAAFWGSFYYLGFSLLVLLCCVDFSDPKQELNDYLKQVESADFPSAIAALPERFVIGATEDHVGIVHQVTIYILSEAFTKMLVGLFWFAICGIYGLGIYGVVFYVTLVAFERYATETAQQQLANFLAVLISRLEWLPARVIGFSFALIGRFGKGSRFCIDHFMDGAATARDFVIQAGLAALDLENHLEMGAEENLAALDMITRTLLVWLFALALILIGVVV